MRKLVSLPRMWAMATPRTAPVASTTGPPLLPGLMATSMRMGPLGSGSASAASRPAFTVGGGNAAAALAPRPKGKPTTNIGSPTGALRAVCSNSRGGRASPTGASKSAKSAWASVCTTRAGWSVRTAPVRKHHAQHVRTAVCRRLDDVRVGEDARRAAHHVHDEAGAGAGGRLHQHHASLHALHGLQRNGGGRRQVKGEGRHRGAERGREQRKISTRRRRAHQKAVVPAGEEAEPAVLIKVGCPAVDANNPASLEVPAQVLRLAKLGVGQKPLQALLELGQVKTPGAGRIEGPHHQMRASPRPDEVNVRVLVRVLAGVQGGGGVHPVPRFQPQLVGQPSAGHRLHRRAFHPAQRPVNGKRQDGVPGEDGVEAARLHRQDPQEHERRQPRPDGAGRADGQQEQSGRGRQRQARAHGLVSQKGEPPEDEEPEEAAQAEGQRRSAPAQKKGDRRAPRPKQ